MKLVKLRKVAATTGVLALGAAAAPRALIYVFTAAERVDELIAARRDSQRHRQADARPAAHPEPSFSALLNDHLSTLPFGDPTFRRWLNQQEHSTSPLIQRIRAISENQEYTP